MLIVACFACVQGEGFKEGKRVLECLQKSLRIADACMDSSMNVKLFVEILNEYLYYFEAKNEAVRLLSFAPSPQLRSSSGLTWARSLWCRWPRST